MSYINPNQFQYPGPVVEQPEYSGVFPVDFLLESVIRAGITWFLEDAEAKNLVFGQLRASWLSKYGQDKIDEIHAYVAKYDIKIVQHFSLIAQNLPCISIQLLDGNEEEARASLDDHMKMIDNASLGEDESVIGRVQWGYAPIVDNIHIGIHAHNTPDLTKYIYYLLVYILSAFKPQLMDRGFHLTTFRATDMSRMNEYLPENIYSRFLNFSCWTIAPFQKGKVPIIDNILGLHVPTANNEVFERENEANEDFRITEGISITKNEDSD